LQGPETDQKECRLGCQSDKEVRKSIHSALKAFPTYVAETVEDPDGGKVIVVRRSSAEDSQGAGSRPRKRRRAEDVPRGAYTTFVMYKENMDTTEAFVRLSEMLRLPPKRFYHAGTKDKRAVTSQEVRIKGISPVRLSHLSKGIPNRQLLLGNFNTSHKEPLLLGQLSGNHFMIFLRGLAATDSEEGVLKAAECARRCGFANYFGLQRFGGGANATHRVGIELVKGNFRKAVEMILQPLDPSDSERGLFSKRQQANAALLNFLSDKISAEEALDILPNWMKVERVLLKSLSEPGASKDYRRALSALPPTLRLMYIHAVQSYIWNKMATFRLEHGSRTHGVEGDFVFVNDNLKESHTLDEEDGSKPLDLLRTVTAEEATSQSIPIGRVVLPLIGERVEIPPGSAGDAIKKVMDDEEINLRAPLEKKLGMRIYGSYRRLIAYPQDLKADVVSYESDTQDVLLTDKKILEGVADHVPEGSLRGVRVEFILQPAQYATMLLRELTRQSSSTDVQKALNTVKTPVPVV